MKRNFEMRFSSGVKVFCILFIVVTLSISAVLLFNGHWHAFVAVFGFSILGILALLEQMKTAIKIEDNQISVMKFWYKEPKMYSFSDITAKVNANYDVILYSKGKKIIMCSRMMSEFSLLMICLVNKSILPILQMNKGDSSRLFIFEQAIKYMMENNLTTWDNLDSKGKLNSNFKVYKNDLTPTGFRFIESYQFSLWANSRNKKNATDFEILDELLEEIKP